MQPIGLDDLGRLREIARQDRELFLATHPDFAVNADRRIAVALCQSAALHFVDGRNGVKDFDVGPSTQSIPFGALTLEEEFQRFRRIKVWKASRRRRFTKGGGLIC